MNTCVLLDTATYFVGDVLHNLAKFYFLLLASLSQVFQTLVEPKCCTTPNSNE